MDANRFDLLARALAAAPSRRAVTQALAGFSLAGGLSALLGQQASDARKKGKKKKRKKKCKGKKKKCGKKCIPKAKCCPACTGEQTCQNGACISTVTCSDGAKNGSETDVDCGGDCPRCATGKTCASRDDCISALCHNVLHTCQECSVDCGVDSDGITNCVCDTTVTGVKVCDKTLPEQFVADCEQCPAGTNCVDLGGGPSCFKPCGAP